MMKKRKLATSVAVFCLAVISLVVFFAVKNSSNASRDRNVSTGESISTIAEYEVGGGSALSNITTYLGYGYNVATKGYIHEKNVNSSSADNLIFNIYPDSTTDKNNIRDTFVKVDNCSRTIEKEIIDGRSIDGYVKQFSTNLSEKRLNLTGDKLNWVPFLSDVYIDIGGKFSRSSLGTCKTAYVTDTMIKRSASVTWMLSEKDYYNYLTDNFKKDVMELEPRELFDKYGTHFFRNVILGGKLTYTANIKASTDKVLNSATAQFKIGVDKSTKSSTNHSQTNTNEKDNPQHEPSSETTSRKNNQVTSGEKDSINYDDKNVNTDITIDCKANVYGGSAGEYTDKFSDIAKAIASYSTEKLESNSGTITNSETKIESTLSSATSDFKNWLTSVDNYPALIDIRDQYSLYPIWDLLDYFPDNDPTISDREAIARKEELEEAFNEYGLENYNNIVKKYENETEDSLYTEIESEVTGVNYLSSYDKSQKLSEEEAEIHKDFKLGHMYVTNAGKTSDGKYMLNDSSFEVSYKLSEDPYNLPLEGDFEEDYVKHTLISDLSYVGQVKGYGNIFSFWKQFAPLKGGYYVQVIYNDNQTDCYSGNNLLKKKNNGDSVVMYTSDASEVEKHGGVSEIKVLLLYKTQAIAYRKFSPMYRWLQEGSIKFE